jgi:hypothetical protein
MPRKIRPIRIEGNIAYVPLTKGYEAIIDADDVQLVSAFNWTAFVRPHTVYACRRDYPSNKTILLHRFLIGQSCKYQVDHCDCNGLNNMRENLREATPSQNQHNKRRSLANKSGFKGVRWHERAQKWNARIHANGTEVYLGLFDSPQLAHAAYARASAELHGEFGRTS